MGASSGCCDCAPILRRLLKRKKAVMTSIRTKPPTAAPEIAPIGGLLGEGLSVGNIEGSLVGGAVLIVTWKISASFGSKSPGGLVIFALPIALYI